MNNLSSSYEAPKINLGICEAKPMKAGILVVFITSILIILNLFLAFVIAAARGEYAGSLAGLIGYSMGAALGVPLLFVAFASIWKRFRNERSKAKVLMWGSVFALFSNIGNFAVLVAKLPK